MIRTQIQLTETQASLLKKLASQRDISIAEIIRQSIDRYLQTETRSDDMTERRKRAKEAIGRFRADVNDLSINHDKYYAETINNFPRIGVDTEKQMTEHGSTLAPS